MSKKRVREARDAVEFQIDQLTKCGMEEVQRRLSLSIPNARFTGTEIELRMYAVKDALHLALDPLC